MGGHGRAPGARRGDEVEGHGGQAARTHEEDEDAVAQQPPGVDIRALQPIVPSLQRVHLLAQR